jgi:cation:H+ antiporter
MGVVSLAAVPLVTLALSLVVLVASARLAVDRLMRVAQRFDVPDVLVAVSVVALGTSLPEIGAHVSASLGIVTGQFDYEVASATALGGNMGSSVTQQLLLFGILLLAYGRFTLGSRLQRDYYVPMVLAAGLLLALAADGTVGRLDALALLAAYAGYTYYVYSRRKRSTQIPATASRNLPLDTVVALLAMAAVFGAAFAAVGAIEAVVGDLALGGSMAGVVTLGLASALPELSTVVVSIRRRLPNLAVGTLVGSNVVNPLVAVGAGAAISTYRVPEVVLYWDLPFKLLAGVAVLVWLRVRPDVTMTRRDGAYLVALYFVYVGGRLLVFPAQ